MIIMFELGMPNRGSWNGKWSGENDLYARVINIGTAKKNVEKYRPIIEKGHFYYNFGDGWGASVTVKVIDSIEARKIRKKSKGFCGYDWMITSIRDKGYISPD